MEKKKFYQYTWLMWVLFFILPPAGIALMWINKKFNKIVRIVLTIVFAIYTIIYLIIIIPSKPDEESGKDPVKIENNEEVKADDQEPADTSEPATDPEADTTEEPEQIDGMRPTHDQAMGKLKLDVAGAFAPNYTVEYVNDEKDVIITLWFEDFTKETCEEGKDDKEAIDALIANYEELCKTYEDYWNDEGYKYGTVTIKIVDVNDKETVLYSFYSGFCDYAITD